MTHLHIDTREGLPHDMQSLLREHPRDTWPENPNFAASVQNWMGAHQMFRQLSALTLEDSEAFQDRKMSPDAYAGRLAHFGNLLVRNLHGHHGWEDREFFPELMATDIRFERGLEMLEADHVELDAVLERFTRNANRVVQLAQLAPDQMREEAAAVLEASGRIDRFLARHLADEEDLVVPIILHHKLRG